MFTQASSILPLATTLVVIVNLGGGGVLKIVKCQHVELTFHSNTQNMSRYSRQDKIEEAHIVSTSPGILHIWISR